MKKRSMHNSKFRYLQLLFLKRSLAVVLCSRPRQCCSKLCGIVDESFTLIRLGRVRGADYAFPLCPSTMGVAIRLLYGAENALDL
jgi:hypothetical protein